MLGIRGNFVKVLKKILLIDHEPHVTRTVRRALESVVKYSICQEYDAAFALHAAHWFRRDLIVVDFISAATVVVIIALQHQKSRDLFHVQLLCLRTSYTVHL